MGGLRFLSQVEQEIMKAAFCEWRIEHYLLVGSQEPRRINKLKWLLDVIRI